MARVPAGANPTLLNITVDAPPAGQETMDVLVGDPNVVISLILPGGSEITAANAASNGFSFLTYTTDGSGTSEDLWSPFSTSGTHTVIQFPAPAPAGVYAVQANAAAAQGDTAMIVMYYPSSTVSLGSVTDAGTYRQGDFVILSGLVFDGTTPIQNATVTAVAGTFLNLNGTIGNYQLTNVTQINSTISQYTYSVQLTNAGAAANNVVASVSTTDPNMTFVQDTVAFGSVGAGATVTGGNPFSFLYPTASSYSLSTLQWTVQAPGAPINVTLLDSGTYDHATGDGIYTGTFTPAVPGNYIVQVTASGTSAAGLPFVRTASTTFHVITPAGQLGAFSDTLGTDPFSGQILGVNITASVNILTAGQYQLTMQLTSSNGHTVQGSGSAQLGAGSGQIVVTFTASQLLTLGVNGPYTMANARLILATPTDSIFADYKDPAGTTQAYVLNSFNPPGLQFTGPYSSTPVDNNGTPGYEVLTIGIGITPLSGYYGYCQSNGALYAGSTQIDSASSMQFYSNGTSSVALNFSGYHIRNAGLNGPYMLRNATVICGNSQVTGDNLFQTPAYTASQFENSVGDFSLSGPTNVTATAATPANIKVDISRIAGLNQSIQFTLNGAPAGSAPTLYFPAVQSAPLINVVIFPGTASAGSYPLTITGASGALSHSVNVTLIIPGVAAPTFNPPAGTYSSAQSVTIGTTTSGASIRYTTDLSIPSETAGTLFTGSPVTVNTTTTIKAIAYASGMADSQVVSATYTFPSAQYQLTTLVSPNATEGSISPATGLHDAGSVVPVTATANTGYTFTGFSGALGGTANPQNITMNAATTVTANFQPGQTYLGGNFGVKSGPFNARVCPVNIGNNGPGVALGAQVTGFTVVQTSAGAQCTPVVVTPMPAVAGDIAPGGTKAASVTVDFTGCGSTALFTVTATVNANSGAATGTIQKLKQFQ